MLTDPRKTLNRHDHPAPTLGTRVAKNPMISIFQSRNVTDDSWGLQEFASVPSNEPSRLGVLGALAVGNFGSG
jgi:hypothetical protein